MSKEAYFKLMALATWPRLAILFLLFLLGERGFDWRKQRLGPEAQVLDVRLWYTPDDAQNLFEQIGEHGRRLYAITQLTLDLVFPFVYGFLFLAFVVHLYPAAQGRWLALVPLAGSAADLLENATTAHLAWWYDGQPSRLAWAAAVFTATKSALFLLSLLVVLVGAVTSLAR